MFDIHRTIVIDGEGEKTFDRVVVLVTNEVKIGKRDNLGEIRVAHQF